jgi:hypothetical protein
MQPYQSPHAAPAQSPQELYRQNVFAPPGASASPLLGRGVRNAKLAFGVAQLVTATVGTGLIVAGVVIGVDTGGGTTMAVGTGLVALSCLLFAAWTVLCFVWLYKFWSWIPPEQRHTNMWRKYISPGTAVGFMLIPYFNIYWLFVLNLGIADIMERMRVAYPTDKPPAKNLALVASILPLVFFPATPIVEYLFNKHVEAMATDMQARMPA